MGRTIVSAHPGSRVDDYSTNDVSETGDKRK
jgi:hypothetical protein